MYSQYRILLWLMSGKGLDFYLTALLAKYQRWLVESPSKMEIRLDNDGDPMKEMMARQVCAGVGGEI